jgi:hypothetical protein
MRSTVASKTALSGEEDVVGTERTTLLPGYCGMV